jgi:TolB-like protein/Flp pilus assembly protein TadD
MEGVPPSQPATTIPVHDPHNRLDSWKDIAAYLKRSVPTVQRWEKEEALPVHRHHHRKQGSVYAYPAEVDTWWRERHTRLETPPRADEAAPRVDDAAPRVDEEPAVQTRPAGWRKGLVIGVAVAVLALAVGASYVVRRARTVQPQERVMLAVLPFQNLGGGASLDYVCDGLTEELITELATINPDLLGVIARTSAMTYRSGDKTIRDIGKELSVEYVVEGSVRFAAGKSRITAQLIRVSDQSHLWARTYEGNPEDFFKLEQDIAHAVAGEVDIRVSGRPARARTQPSADPEAYRLYLQGRQHWNKRSQAGLERSIELFEESLKHDPRNARAYAGLADAFNMLGYFGYRPLGLVVPKAQDAARRALDLDDQLSAAHAALGYINLMWLWDWREAERRFQRAIQLEANYVPAHHYYALFLAAAGRLPEARREIAIAQRLDPLAPAVNTGSAYVLFFDRQYERSVEHCQRVLDQDPTNAIAHAVRGWNLVQLGRHAEGIASLERALEFAPGNSLYVATLARAFTLAGDTARAARILDDLEELSKHKWVGGSMRSIVYAARGDRDAAFKWLDDALKQEDGFLLWAKVTPEFDSLREDARFNAVLDRLKLP